MSIKSETRFLKELTDSEYKVYSAICLFRDDSIEDYVPADVWLMNITGKSRATIYRAIYGLKVKGII
jgi:predicted house-cleaning NTP pyrophosphatase (Maf/HAM1 superfamily)